MLAAHKTGSEIVLECYFPNVAKGYKLSVCACVRACVRARVCVSMFINTELFTRKRSFSEKKRDLKVIEVQTLKKYVFPIHVII